MQKTAGVEGYSIYHPDVYGEWGGYRFDFDKTIGQTMAVVNATQHENRTELLTFGSKPYVYYAGNADYMSFPLQGIFVTEYDSEGEVERRAIDIYNEFKRVLRRRVPLLVENSIGEEFNCDVSLAQRVSPLHYAENDMDFIEVNVTCTEIDEIGGR